jgi:hypothetical protein
MCCIRIERAENGYTVSAIDPKIAAENDKPGSKWRDPNREYVFKTIGEVMAFVEKIADIALPVETSSPDPFSKAFNAAVRGGEDKD